MKAKDAIGRIAKIIMKLGNIEEPVAFRIAERVYADVVAAQVTEELDRWFMVVYSDNDTYHS